MRSRAARLLSAGRKWESACQRALEALAGGGQVAAALGEDRVVVPRLGVGRLHVEGGLVEPCRALAVAAEHRLGGHRVEDHGGLAVVGDAVDAAVGLRLVGQEVDGVDDAVHPQAAHHVGGAHHGAGTAAEHLEVLDLHREGVEAGAARQGEVEVDQRQAVAALRLEGLDGGPGGIALVVEAEAAGAVEDVLDHRVGLVAHPARHVADALARGADGGVGGEGGGRRAGGVADGRGHRVAGQRSRRRQRRPAPRRRRRAGPGRWRVRWRDAECCERRALEAWRRGVHGTSWVTG